MKTDVKENRFYVYLHRDVNGVVFYVGKGTRDRAMRKDHRSGKWAEVANGGVTYQIIKDYISNKEAVILETALIGIYRDSIVNSKSSKVTKELCFKALDEVFYYDESSPSGLRWKIDKFRRGSNKIYSVGDVAGFKQFLKNGTPKAWRVTHEYVSYPVHRIIWVLTHGTISTDLVVDHLDGNAFNNDILNLKLKSYADNSRNQKIKPTSTGVVGVVRRFNPSGAVCFRVTWRDETGKQIGKNISSTKHGEDMAFELACKLRFSEIQKLKQKGLDYTHRHICFTGELNNSTESLL